MTKNERIRKYLIMTRIKRALTARVVSLLITSLVGWLVTGNPLIGLSIGLVDMTIKIGVYYCHETVWERKMTKDIQMIKLQYEDENEKPKNGIG